MPNKFPHLKSTSEPIGPVEQLGMAITLNHQEDPADNPDNSWFGRMLSDDATAYFQLSSDKPEFFPANKQMLTQAYYRKNGDLLFTAFDWKCDFLRVEDSSNSGSGFLEGRVVIKGRCALGAFSIDPANYKYVVYEIVRNNNTKDRWKIKRWSLFFNRPNQWGPVNLDTILTSS